MPIKSSSSGEIRALVDALSGDDRLRRDAAVARLTVIGRRATERLLGAYREASDPGAKVAILQTLERIADTRAAAVACGALQEGGDVAVAAAAVLKPLIDGTDATDGADRADPSTASAALDALIDATLDPSRERRVRLAAYTALEGIPRDMLVKLADALHIDVATAAHEETTCEAILDDAIDGRLPQDPDVLRQAVATGAATAPLTSLQKLIDVIRAREQASKQGAGRTAWQDVRGAAHQALALRGCRLALYDLRETVAAADRPLPPAFMSAMRSIGDASCVESIAAALANAPANDLWWRHQLASALRTIVKRERMTRRHASVKRALARWPQAAEAFH